MYGPRTTIGQSYQQWSNTQSGNGINKGYCSGSHCAILFQRVPQGKSLIVQHVSCRVFIDTGEVGFGSLYTRKGQAIFMDRATPLSPVNAGGGHWAVSNVVRHPVKPNERPVLRFFADAADAWNVACSISGRLAQP